MVGWHHQLNGHDFEQAPGGSEGQGSLVCCSSCGGKKSDTTQRLNNNLGYMRSSPPSSPLCFLTSQRFMDPAHICQMPAMCQAPQSVQVPVPGSGQRTDVKTNKEQFLPLKVLKPGGFHKNNSKPRECMMNMVCLHRHEALTPQKGINTFRPSAGIIEEVFTDKVIWPGQ